MLTSGQLLADRYRLVRRIAVGGMGEVWEATDSRLDRAVAIKVLKPELSGDAEFLHRFRTEARTTASLNHPGIAAVHDYGETASVPDGPQDTAYLVMELVEGDPLAALIARNGRLRADWTLDILHQAGTALQAAHERGYVHRDVKPGNILVTPNGKVKITDFGIAKAADAAPVTRSGMVMGTAHYIAPEQAVGQEAEPASDVYSLAVVGYECLVGHRPFLSENAVTVAMMHIREIAPPLPPDVPPGTRALIEATLVKDPRQRYRDGGEFAAAVGAVRAGLPLPTPSGLAVAAPMHVQGQPGGPPSYPQSATPMGSIPVVPQQGPPAGAPMSPGTGTFLLGPPPQNRPNRVGLWVLLAVLVAVLVALLAAWGVHAWLGSPGGTAPGSGSTGQHPTAGVMGSDRDVPQAVTVDEAAYRGTTAAAAEERLRQQGLSPEVRTATGGQPTDPQRCWVSGVTPNGLVAARSTVAVLCSERGPGG
ncbi:serine/threonine-protein kinase [Kutzneria albida]|uniref:non-specific serine/threonine protein kinase n=1 Tax=Kutzneria albida DSM 43870 TaxID=1449976 RepID=W5W5B4_9PSEU|nr:serine/threonine-protein kinase [Kutzneria albida]AHH93399.1 putative serine/threonine protein kinase [Kutzneria albida DSM 43870]